MELIGTSDRGCVLELHVKKKNLHAYDRVHGGVMASLINSAIGYAAHRLIRPGFGANTSQLSVNYLRSAEIGEVLTASSDLIHCGAATIVGTCRVCNQNGEEVAFGTATLIVKPVEVLYGRIEGVAINPK